MKLWRNIVLGIIAVLPATTFAIDAVKFKSDLILQKENYYKTIETYSVSSIYSEEEWERKSTFLSKIFDSSEKESQEKLRKSGYELLSFLQNAQDDYDSLSFNDWVEVVSILLEIDDIVSTGDGWGNLVVKIKICNMLLDRLAKLLLIKNNELNEEKYSHLLNIQKNIMGHYPSNSQIMLFSLRYYGFSEFHEIDMKLKEPFWRYEKSVERQVARFIDKKNVRKTFSGMIKHESDKNIHGYIEIYDDPVPFSIASTSKYHLYAWRLYLYTILLKEKGMLFEEWSDITQDKLIFILNKEYNSGTNYWMSPMAVKYLEKPLVYKRYLELIKSKKLMSTIKNNYIEKPRKTDNYRTRMSPHKLN
jgi:hypothetical protein